MLIKVKVISASKKNKVIKKEKDEFTVMIKSKPFQGEANKEVREVLSKYFNIDQSELRLKRGFKKRNKIFEIIK